MKKVDLSTSGGRLRDARKKLGMTQADLAAALDRSRALVASVETGRDLGGRDFWAKAASELGLTLDYLLGEGGNTEAPGDAESDDNPLKREFIDTWDILTPPLQTLAHQIVTGLRDHAADASEVENLAQRRPPKKKATPAKGVKKKA